jgi:hypothetical protein
MVALSATPLRVRPCAARGAVATARLRSLAAGVPLPRSVPLLSAPRSSAALRVRASTSPYQEAEVRSPPELLLRLAG